MKGSNVESIIIRVLRVGVVISSLIIILGISLLFITGNSDFNTDNISFSMVFTSAANLHPSYIIMIGLLVLILTPVFRIIASLIMFYNQKDRTYVCITIIVLIILSISFLIGFIV
ncbi:MAG: DUF1634 domain-containing protein [Clostridium sp.]